MAIILISFLYYVCRLSITFLWELFVHRYGGGCGVYAQLEAEWTDHYDAETTK